MLHRYAATRCFLSRDRSPVIDLLDQLRVETTATWVAVDWTHIALGWLFLFGPRLCISLITCALDAKLVKGSNRSFSASQRPEIPQSLVAVRVGALVLCAADGMQPRSVAHSLVSRLAARALLVFGIIYLLALVYGSRNFYRDPGSAFYDEARAFDRRYSAYREKQAAAYIVDATHASAAGRPFPRAAVNASICATFLTVTRNVEQQYLENTVASALQSLAPAERADINVKVYFANTDPSHHSAWNSPWLRDAVDQVYTYKEILGPIDLSKIKELEEANEPLNKAPTDYGIAMRYCMDFTSAPYIAIIEDDVLFAESWLVRSLLSLREIERKQRAAGKPGKWMYMRLFNQERSTGWKSRWPGGNNELWISAAIGAPLWYLLSRLRGVSGTVRRHVDKGTMVAICCIMVPLTVVLFFQAGKASLFPPKPGVRSEPFGCCAQGLIFNREHIEGLSDYLRGAGKGRHDMMTRDWAWWKGYWPPWAQYPVMMQHVGTHSSIQKDLKESSHVWSMAFEDLDPKQLAREHGEMLSRYYGSRAFPNDDSHET